MEPGWNVFGWYLGLIVVCVGQKVASVQDGHSANGDILRGQMRELRVELEGDLDISRAEDERDEANSAAPTKSLSESASGFIDKWLETLRKYEAQGGEGASRSTTHIRYFEGLREDKKGVSPGCIRGTLARGCTGSPPARG